MGAWDAGDADAVLSAATRDPVTGLIGFSGLVHAPQVPRSMLRALLDFYNGSTSPTGEGADNRRRSDGVLMSIRSSSAAQSRRSSLVQQHPLTCFLVLTYLAAWCLWAPLVIFRGTLPPAVGFILVMLGSLVPSTIAIVLVAMLHGKRGVRRFLGRLVRWRVGLRWYAVALVVPLLVPLGLGITIVGGRAPTVDSSVIAILAMFVFSIFPGSALGKSSAGGDSLYRICRTATAR